VASSERHCHGWNWNGVFTTLYATMVCGSTVPRAGPCCGMNVKDEYDTSSIARRACEHDAWCMSKTHRCVVQQGAQLQRHLSYTG
jgi:hypothetical protein